MKIGIGYDIHPLVPGRRLVLGGVEIPFDKGLQGHSDADVLIHAICNALLGALGEGDLGARFPSSDPRYRDYPSGRFLEEVASLVRQKGYRIVNVDSNIIAQAPRLLGFVEEMCTVCAKAMALDRAQVSIKPANPEGVGGFGKGEGIAAQAVCLIEKVAAGDRRDV